MYNIYRQGHSGNLGVFIYKICKILLSPLRTVGMAQGARCCLPRVLELQFLQGPLKSGTSWQTLGSTTRLPAATPA